MVLPVPAFSSASLPGRETRAIATATNIPGELNTFGFTSVHLKHDATMLYPFDEPAMALQGNFVRQSDGSKAPVALVPLGNAPALRRVTFRYRTNTIDSVNPRLRKTQTSQKASFKNAKEEAATYGNGEN